ncbi:hypothetical protein [Dongia deserti]|nr:hypothetical protein [Dongia deserti]
MTNTAFECAANGWPMIAGGIALLALLALSGAALVKYLFLGDRPSAAA